MARRGGRKSCRARRGGADFVEQPGAGCGAALPSIVVRQAHHKGGGRSFVVIRRLGVERLGGTASRPKALGRRAANRVGMAAGRQTPLLSSLTASLISLYQGRQGSAPSTSLRASECPFDPSTYSGQAFAPLGKPARGRQARGLRFAPTGRARRVEPLVVSLPNHQQPPETPGVRPSPAKYKLC